MESEPEVKTKDHLELEQERDDLAGDLVTKIDELKNVARDLAKSAILSRAQRTALLLMTLVIAIMAGALISLGLQNRTNTAATKESSESTQQVVTLIRDCLDPRGKCYKNSKTNQTNSVELINQVTTAAAVCAKTEPTEILIRSCIEEKVAAK